MCGLFVRISGALCSQVQGVGAADRQSSQVWTFIMSDASFRTIATQHASIGYAPEVATGKVKMVCVDAKLVEKDAAEQQE